MASCRYSITTLNSGSVRHFLARKRIMSFEEGIRAPAGMDVDAKAEAASLFVSLQK